jgi:hypothetical protein
VSWELVTNYSSNVTIIASGSFAVLFAFLGSHTRNAFARTLVLTSKYSIPFQMVSVFIGANLVVLLAMLFQVLLLAKETFVVTGLFGYLSAATTIMQANVFWILSLYMGHFLPKWIAYPISIGLPFGFEAFATAQESKGHLFQNLGQTSAPMLVDPLAQKFNWFPQVFSVTFWLTTAVLLVTLHYFNSSSAKTTPGLISLGLSGLLFVCTLGLASEPVVSRNSQDLVCKFSAPSVCIWPETYNAIPSVSKKIFVTSRKLALFGLPIANRITTEVISSDFRINSPYSSSQSNVAKSVAVEAITRQGCDVMFAPGSNFVSTIQAQFALSVLLGADVTKTAPTLAFGGEASSSDGPTEIFEGMNAAKLLGVYDVVSANDILARWQNQIRKGCQS